MGSAFKRIRNLKPWKRKKEGKNDKARDQQTCLPSSPPTRYPSTQLTPFKTQFVQSGPAGFHLLKRLWNRAGHQLPWKCKRSSKTSPMLSQLLPPVHTKQKVLHIIIISQSCPSRDILMNRICICGFPVQDYLYLDYL